MTGWIARDAERTGPAHGCAVEGDFASAPVSWRLLGMLFIVSGTLGFLALPFGLGVPFDHLFVMAIGAPAIASGGLTLAIAHKLPESWLVVGLFNCVALVSVAVAGR
jgi:hypothetical protein